MDEMVFVIYILIFLVLLGLAFIPAKLASNKGYSFGLFYFFGVCFWLPALIVALVIQDKTSGSQTTARASDNADALLKYKQLLDAGAITQEEFDVKKGELLRAAPASQVAKQASEPERQTRSEIPPQKPFSRTRTAWTFSLCAGAIGLIESLVMFFLLSSDGFGNLVGFMTAPFYSWWQGYIIPQPFFYADICAAFAGAFLMASRFKKTPGLAYAGIAFCALSGVFLLLAVIVTMLEIATFSFLLYSFADFLIRTALAIPPALACAAGAFSALEMRAAPKA